MNTINRVSEHTTDFMIEQERMSITHFTNLARIAGENGHGDEREEYLFCVRISETKIEQLKVGL